MLNNLSARMRSEITDVTDPAGVVSLQGTEHDARTPALDRLLQPTRSAARSEPRRPGWQQYRGNPASLEPLVGNRRGVLSEAECKQVFRAVGIPAPGQVFVRPADDLNDAIGQLSFPLVLKVVSSSIPHKSELGLVRTGISDADVLREAKADMIRKVDSRPYEGFLVSEQVTGHREMILGLQRDEKFGMTVVVGAGGVMAEELTRRQFPCFQSTETLPTA